DVIIAVLGEASIDLIRRLGPVEDRVGEARGGVVPELLLPGTGKRLHMAGYPVFASIAFDFASIFPMNAVSDDESPQVYVPYGVFRY
ncbi:MAG TPA: hypothetical protein VJ932_05060, partial [Alkalispirochaeta sp.]|nr:hypothetical protein [Alkalispirochaeta sp.]